VTPFEVWFGRPPRLQGTDRTIEEDLEVEGGLIDSADEDHIFSELHKRVFAKNAYEATKMVKKGGAKTTYELGQIVLLAIPRKNRLSVEATRLPARIIKVVKGAYTLLSQHGPLKGRHQGSSLVPVVSGEAFGIPEVPEIGAKAIALPTAVTKANNRKSISAQQKQGAEATRKRKGGPDSSKAGPAYHTRAERLVHQEAGAVAVQSELDDQFARGIEQSVERRGEHSIIVATPTPVTRATKRRKGKGKAVSFAEN
jgi:hypothetical protein